ncbi:hypothetical protein JVT61DRAFT_11065 [Boletus reticuloceps]|uniref:Uncharacterized protein n=1 Tax=Boletus reticuloceps TaxID=495285 RepID=A0A8I2YF56_9AGAM|nr:hypothetical protein JVT61DRAFT_11065 [Boletus reticuloceps]
MTFTTLPLSLPSLLPFHNSHRSCSLPPWHRHCHQLNALYPPSISPIPPLPVWYRCRTVLRGSYQSPQWGAQLVVHGIGEVMVWVIHHETRPQSGFPAAPPPQPIGGQPETVTVQSTSEPAAATSSIDPAPPVESSIERHASLSFSMSNIDSSLCPDPSAHHLLIDSAIEPPVASSSSMSSIALSLPLASSTTLSTTTLSSSILDLLSSSRVNMVDPSINPCHVSQLRPIFSEHVAGVHERAEKKCQRDLELVLEKRRIREHVIAFSFFKNDEDPVTVDFQHGFIYPYFKLTHSVLVDLDLVQVGDDVTITPAVHYFDSALDTWVKMKVNSVIELTKPSQKLFFKGINVTSYPSFDRHFHSIVASHMVLNPHASLSEECTHVKKIHTIMKNLHLVHRNILYNQTCYHNSPCDPSDSDDVISIHDDKSLIDDQPVTIPPIAHARLPPGIVPAQARFPSSFYVMDVVAAFAMSKTRDKVTTEHQFQTFFGVSWKSSTFYDHRARWYSTPLDVCEKAIAAGYSDEGLYSVFLAAHAPKDTELKAAKRKIWASQHN